MPRGGRVGVGAEDAGGRRSLGELGVGCSDSLACGVWGARFPPPLVDVRRGQKLLWAGGGAPGVGWLVAAAGAKGALVTSGRSPSLSGELQTSPPPPAKSSAAGAEDLTPPLRCPGVGGFFIR